MVKHKKEGSVSSRKEEDLNRVTKDFAWSVYDTGLNRIATDIDVIGRSIVVLFVLKPRLFLHQSTYQSFPRSGFLLNLLYVLSLKMPSSKGLRFQRNADSSSHLQVSRGTEIGSKYNREVQTITQKSLLTLFECWNNRYLTYRNSLK